MSVPLESTLLFGSPGLTNVENQVKSLIVAAESNIERLKTHIRELDCMLERERATLAKLRALVAPIGKLPTELLVEIFKHAVHTPLLDDTPISSDLPEIQDMFEPAARTALRNVFRLSQVSPYWRQIVRTTPQLWAEGVVAVELDWREGFNESSLQDLLARSSPFPISVSLTQSHNGTSIGPAIVHVLPLSILNTAHRWRNLTLDLFPFHVDHFNALAPGTFEALERLHIRTKAHHKEPVTAFQFSPRLRNFTLQTLHGSQIEADLFQMPWSQLTHLQISDRSVGGCRAILLQCRNLVSAQFITSHKWDFGQMQSPVVALPFLKTLVVTFSGASDVDGPGGIEAFFLPLALPSLQTLSLNFDPNIEDFGRRKRFPSSRLVRQISNRSACSTVMPTRMDYSLFSDMLPLLRHSGSITVGPALMMKFLKPFDTMLGTLRP
ncbi:hypothetical protein DFH09DRAFT_173533 [Mycena vulgaris]|nr:hypothetical protein DFH09DRAFT_173533 [Mycena vulgaris]